MKAAPQEICAAGRSTRTGRNAAAAYCRQPAGVGFHVAGDDVAQRNSFQSGFMVSLYEFFYGHDGQNGRQPVVAASRRTHGRQFNPCHARISGCGGHDTRGCHHVLSNHPLAHQPIEGFSHTQAGTVLESILRKPQVKLNALLKEGKIIGIQVVDKG